MTPDALPGFIREFGLPLAMLFLFAMAILKRWLVTGAELSQMRDLFERERGDRIAAEANVARFAGANAEVAEAVREVLTEVVRKDAFNERLAPRRGK